MTSTRGFATALSLCACLATPAASAPHAQTATGVCTQIEGYNTCRAAFALVAGTLNFQIDYLGCELKGESATQSPNLQASRLVLRTTLAGKSIALPIQVVNPTQALTRDAAYSTVSLPLSFTIAPNQRLIVTSETRTGVVASMTCTVTGRFV